MAKMKEPSRMAVAHEGFLGKKPNHELALSLARYGGQFCAVPLANVKSQIAPACRFSLVTT
jgi:hypothetical protein